VSAADDTDDEAEVVRAWPLLPLMLALGAGSEGVAKDPPWSMVM
jgi:hypothetical protein